MLLASSVQGVTLTLVRSERGRGLPNFWVNVSSGGLRNAEPFLDHDDAPKGPLSSYMEAQKSKETTS